MGLVEFKSQIDYFDCFGEDQANKLDQDYRMTADHE